MKERAKKAAAQKKEAEGEYKNIKVHILKTFISLTLCLLLHQNKYINEWTKK